MILAQSKLYGFEADGMAADLSQANKKINEARNATPEDSRHLFRSSIRWCGPRPPQYSWSWVIK